MRAAILRELGAVPEAGEWDEPPAPGDGETLVTVAVAGINPIDVSMASGTFYGGAPPVPYVLGREGIGHTDDGALVYFDAPIPPSGSMAERTLARTDSLIELPAGADPAASIAFGIAGLAGWLALSDAARLEPGESVLVLGASGAVGRIAVQGARLLGASRVVAAARRTDGLERLGADAVCGLEADELRDACGEGVDVIVDPLWGAPVVTALGAAARHRTRVIQLGQSAGATAEIPSALVRGRSLSIIGHTNFAVAPDIRRAALRTMVEHGMAGELTVPTEALPLDRIAEAWERQASSPGAKLAIVPG